MLDVLDSNDTIDEFFDFFDLVDNCDDILCIDELLDNSAAPSSNVMVDALRSVGRDISHYL